MLKTTKTGLWVIATSFVALGVIGSQLEDYEKVAQEPPAEHGQGLVELAAGEVWRTVANEPIRSVNGYHQATALRARFLDEDGTGTALVAAGIDERPISRANEVSFIDFDPKLLEEAIEPAFTVKIPEGLAGHSGKIELAGELLIASAQVDTAENRFEVTTTSRSFESQQEVTIVGLDDPLEGVGPASDSASDEPVPPMWLVVGRNILVVTMFLGVALLLLGGVGAKVLLGSLAVIFLPIIIYTTFIEEESEASTSPPRSESEDARDAGHRVKRDLVRPGDVVELKPEVGVSAVDSFHRVAHISAWLKGVGGEQIELEAKPTGNKPWSNPIKVGYLRVGPLFKTSRFSVNPVLEVTLPPAERIDRDSGTLVVSGVLLYPDIGRLEILNPLDIEYEIGEKVFSLTRALSFSDQELEAEAREGPGFMTKLLFSISSFGLIFLAGATILSIKRRAFT